MTAKTLLAVDFGASGGKCFAGTFGNNGSFQMEEIHRFAHEGISFYIPDRNNTVSERIHWDDTFLYQNIITGLQTAKRELSATVDSIGVDTWGADGQIMSADGDMLGKVYCYRDHRLDEMIDKVKARIDPRRIYEITGIHFQPFNLSNQLLWLVENRPELLLPGAYYLPVPALFTFYLCGAKVVDSSWASVTQLMDAATRDWSAEVLSALGIPAQIMPEIVAPGTAAGKMHPALAEKTGMPPPTVIATAAHDTAGAFAAAPVDDPARALIISSGTWSLIGKLIPEPVTNITAMEAGISNEGGIGNVRFLKNCMGTWLVQELRRGWRDTDGTEPAWRDLDEMTAAAPAHSAVIDPDDQAFYNPADMEKAIVEFCRKTGQNPPESRGAFLRVVYESLALKYRFVNQQICAACGQQTEVIHIVGGGSRNTLLNRFVADAMNMPVLAGPEEATAVGNLMTQALGLGLLPDMQAAQPVIRAAFPIKEYRPEGDNAAWEAAYRNFIKLCNPA